MSLQDDIFASVRNTPPWKQELYLRAAVSPELSPEDVREVTAMLLGEAVVVLARALSVARISRVPTAPVMQCASARFRMLTA